MKEKPRIIITLEKEVIEFLNEHCAFIIMESDMKKKFIIGSTLIAETKEPDVYEIKYISDMNDDESRSYHEVLLPYLDFKLMHGFINSNKFDQP